MTPKKLIMILLVGTLLYPFLSGTATPLQVWYNAEILARHTTGIGADHPAYQWKFFGQEWR